MTRRLLVCQNRTCRRQGSPDVLAALRAHALPDTEIEGCGCLGQCGNGPMMLVLPDDVWYDRLCAAEIPAIVERHLYGGTPVRAMLYRKFHPPSS